jgi:hypothetical protein
MGALLLIVVGFASDEYKRRTELSRPCRNIWQSGGISCVMPPAVAHMPPTCEAAPGEDLPRLLREVRDGGSRAPGQLYSTHADLQ